MAQNSIEAISLTKSQQIVLDKIIKFVKSSAERVFILKGYAGTGKTTLMRFLIKELRAQNSSYTLLASTGRAAKVLANLSGTNGGASTVHSLIYFFKGLSKTFEEGEEIKVDDSGQLYLVFEPMTVEEHEQAAMIYIVDEASMVSDVKSMDVTQAQYGDGRLLKNLLEYDKRPQSKFIFVGDPCQLPPVEQYYSPALMPAYFREHLQISAQETQLTEIMRQGNNSGIVYASKKIRESYNGAPEYKSSYGTQRVWAKLPFRYNQDIVLHAMHQEMIDDYVEKVKKYGLNSAICICKTNAQCNQLSQTIRAKLGLQGHLQVGDLLMIVQNNMPTGLMNGDMVIVEEISNHVYRRANLTFRNIKVKELFSGNSCTHLVIEEVIFQRQLNLSAVQQQELYIDFIIRMRQKGITQQKKELFYKALQKDEYLNALRCMYGYAVTCHKAQGGEWEDVYVDVPRNLTLNPTKEDYQWIYTAMTRAKDKLHMVDDFYFI